MQYKQTKIPQDGIYLKKQEGSAELEVWYVEAVRVGTLKEARVPGRKVYKTSDNEVFTNAAEAGEHELDLVRTGKVKP